MGLDRRANPIEATLAVLERWGWVSGAFEASDGFCVVGAFESVTGLTLRGGSLYEMADLIASFDVDSSIHLWLGIFALVGATVDPPLTIDEASERWSLHDAMGAIIRFNDDPEHTWEDTALMLKRASATYDTELA